jgi:hypothetical protein
MGMNPGSCGSALPIPLHPLKRDFPATFAKADPSKLFGRPRVCAQDDLIAVFEKTTLFARLQPDEERP